MDRNPYAPPGSNVTAVPAEPERPGAAVLAVCLVALAALIRVATWLFAYVSGGVTNGGMIVLLIVLPVAIGVPVWLGRGLWQGHPWARVVSAVYLCLGVAYGVLSLPRADSTDRMDWAYLVHLAIMAAAVALLYTPAVHTWLLRGRTSNYRSRKRLSATSGLGQ